MLRKLSVQVQTCFDRALDAKRRADGTADPARKAELHRFEKSWLALAESYELTERLTDFTAENAGWRRRFNERRRVGARQDDEVRLQRIIEEGNVEALFERMWLSSIVEFSDDAIISKNLDGTITSWNKGAERLFGYLAEEAIGKPVTMLIPADRQYEEGAILKLVRRGDRVEHYETVRQRKDGTRVDISLTVSPIRGAEGKVVAASKVARDITERKQERELLRRQADLLDQSRDAIFTWKIGGGIVYWSKGAERLYNFTAEEAIGRSSHELLRTRSPVPMQEIEWQIAHEGSWYGELTHTTRDERTVVVESRLVRVQYSGGTYTLETNRDITERKAHEEYVHLLTREAEHRAKTYWQT
jgi:PAS domain S-box-containing protein